MSEWLARLAVLAVCWWLAMTYPKDDSLRAMVGALVIGTIGFVLACISCYYAGVADGRAKP